MVKKYLHILQSYSHSIPGLYENLKYLIANYFLLEVDYCSYQLVQILGQRSFKVHMLTPSPLKSNLSFERNFQLLLIQTSRILAQDFLNSWRVWSFLT